MEIKVGQYMYMPRGRNFRVYKKVTDTRLEEVISEPVYFSREEARRRVYELNGWRLKK